MSLQGIKFNGENPYGYKALANRAAALEKRGLWRMACDIWETARKVAKESDNAGWAQTRADYCLMAIARNWRSWRAAA